MTIAEKIDEIRSLRKVSKDALERAAGLSAGRICKWLNGHGSPSVDQMIKIADVLGVLPVDLINGTPVGDSFPRQRFGLEAQRRILELAFRLGEEEATKCMMRHCVPKPKIERRRAPVHKRPVSAQ